MRLFGKITTLALLLFVIACGGDKAEVKKPEPEDPGDINNEQPLPPGPPTPAADYCLVPDLALAQYLVYNSTKATSDKLPENVCQKYSDEKYYITRNIAKAFSGTLYLKKDAASITRLKNAGVTSAQSPITNLAGLECFSKVTTLRITVDNLQTPFNYSLIPSIETLEMHTSDNLAELHLPALLTGPLVVSSGDFAP